MNRKALVALAKRKLSLREIGIELGLSYTATRYWVKKFKVKLYYGPAGKLPDWKHKERSTSPCRCGESDPVQFYTNFKKGIRHSNCKKCDNTDRARKMTETKEKACKALGGKCVICGYSKFFCALDFHHLNGGKDKDPNFSRLRGWSFNRVLEELKKCVLLCSNCHRAVTSGLLKEPVGPQLAGRSIALRTRR